MLISFCHHDKKRKKTQPKRWNDSCGVIFQFSMETINLTVNHSKIAGSSLSSIIEMHDLKYRYLFQTNSSFATRPSQTIQCFHKSFWWNVMREGDQIDFVSERSNNEIVT